MDIRIFRNRTSGKSIYSCCIGNTKKLYKSKYLCKDGKIRRPMRGAKDWFDDLTSLLNKLMKWAAKENKKLRFVKFVEV